MSDTPRTDALALLPLDPAVNPASARLTNALNLCAKLERELAEMYEALRALESEYNALVRRGSTITEVVGSDGQPVSAPCVIDGCQLFKGRAFKLSPTDAAPQERVSEDRVQPVSDDRNPVPAVAAPTKFLAVGYIDGNSDLQLEPGRRPSKGTLLYVVAEVGCPGVQA